MSGRLNREITEGLNDPDESMLARWEALRADISNFVEGSFVNWGLMKWLDPKKYEHWTLRSCRPRPSIRIFGRFAEPDVFVGTHSIARSLLGGKWSAQFEHEKLVCEDIWNEAKLGKPFSSDNYTDYITNNAAKDLKVMS